MDRGASGPMLLAAPPCRWREGAAPPVNERTPRTRASPRHPGNTAAAPRRSWVNATPFEPGGPPVRSTTERPDRGHLPPVAAGPRALRGRGSAPPLVAANLGRPALRVQNDRADSWPAP